MARIKLKWKGEEITLTESQAFEACDAIEQVVTFGELVQMRQDGAKLRFAQLSKAYAAMLTEAGVVVTAREVHSEVMAAVREGEQSDKLALALEAIDWLLIVLMDGAPDEGGEGDTKGNPETPA